MKDTVLRQGFDTEAQLYDDARPGYPPEVFEALIEATDLQPDANLLEIGPGTGQATLPLAERGFQITGVELGANMAAVAQSKLERFPKVKILVGSFEDTELPVDTYDLIYSATAFHWLKPEVKFTKTHELLKDGGHLAIIHNNHVSDDAGDLFFHKSQPIYEKYGQDFCLPHQPHKNSRPPKSSDIEVPDFDTDRFKKVLFKIFPMIINYRSQAYVDMVATYSPTLAMPQPERSEFLADLKSLIDGELGAGIEKHYAISLTVLKKR